MSLPTEAEIQDQIGKVMRLLEEEHKFGTKNAKNYVGMEDAIIQAVESDFADDLLAQLGNHRQRLANMLADCADLLQPLLLTYGQVIGLPDPDLRMILLALFDRFVANNLRVTSRQFTFGPVVAGGANVGNGTILRLNTDQDGFPIENQFAETKTAKVVRDANTGASRHEEALEVRGKPSGRDTITMEDGSGAQGTLNAVSVRGGLLDNASLDTLTGSAAAVTAVDSWTPNIDISGGAVLGWDDVNYYRDFAGATLPKALKMKASVQLGQKLSLRGRPIRADWPYQLQVAFRRDLGAGDGTLTLRMGAQSTVVVVAAQAGWNLARVPAVPGSGCWYKQFQQADPEVRIEWARNAGDLLIDDILWVPYQKFSGGWYLPIGGSVPFRRDDAFSWLDSEIGAIIQRWFWRSFGFSLPSAVPGPAVTWAEPA